MDAFHVAMIGAMSESRILERSGLSA